MTFQQQHRNRVRAENKAGTGGVWNWLPSAQGHSRVTGRTPAASCDHLAERAEHSMSQTRQNHFPLCSPRI